MLHLHFECKIPPDGLYTLTEIQRQVVNDPVKVEVRNSSGSIVPVGTSQSPLRVEIVVLEERGNGFMIAKGRKDKPASLLKGNCEFPVHEGVAHISGIAFTDNSSCRHNKTFRFGVKVVSGLPSGVRIKNAVSKPFRVKERRAMKTQQQNPTSVQAESSCVASCSHTEQQGALVEDFIPGPTADTIPVMNSAAKTLGSPEVNNLIMKAIGQDEQVGCSMPPSETAALEGANSNCLDGHQTVALPISQTGFQDPQFQEQSSTSLLFSPEEAEGWFSTGDRNDDCLFPIVSMSGIEVPTHTPDPLSVLIIEEIINFNGQLGNFDQPSNSGVRVAKKPRCS